MIIDINLLNAFIKDTEKKPLANKFFKGLLESEKVIIIEITDEYNHMNISLKVKDGIYIDSHIFGRGDILELYVDTVEGDFDTFIEAKNNRTYGSEYIDFNGELYEL